MYCLECSYCAGPRTFCCQIISLHLLARDRASRLRFFRSSCLNFKIYVHDESTTTKRFLAALPPLYSGEHDLCFCERTTATIEIMKYSIIDGHRPENSTSLNSMSRKAEMLLNFNEAMVKEIRKLLRYVV